MTASIAHADFLSWPALRTLIKACAQHHIVLHVVGGAVRDALRGAPVREVDFCTPAMPEPVMQALAAEHIRTIPTGLAHGTITAIVDGVAFEITTLRRDVACDGRHAEVAFTDDFAADAARRDFTINALYADASGTVYDYTGGLRDLEQKRLRFVGEASARMQEDALRILRLFRFYAELGFSVDEATWDACRTHAGLLKPISTERIHVEVFKLLTSDQPYAAVTQMVTTGVWQCISGASPLFTATQMMQVEEALALPEAAHAALLRFAALIAPTVDTSLAEYTATQKSRWALSNKEHRTLGTWFEHALRFHIPDSLAEARRMQRSLGTDDYLAVCFLSALYGATPHALQPLIADARRWQPPEFPVRGSDLIARGVPEGKHLGEALARLEAQWEAADYQLTAEELLARLSR